MKRFLGWEPETTYGYKDGRLVSSVTESEWDDTEQSWMLALKQYEDELCPLCGGPSSECMDVNNELKFRAEAPVRCHRTTQRGIMAEKYRTDKTIQPGALLYPVELRD